MKLTKILLISLLFNSHYVFADDKSIEQCVTEQEKTNPVINDKALLWYHTSAERTALFRQIFSTSLTQINNKIKDPKAKLNNWGVIIGLDNVLLDSSEYKYYQYLGCTAPNSSDYKDYIMTHILPANPGAADLTCKIKAMGGKVFIVTNRNAGGDDSTELMNATVSNLNEENICYDSILYANDSTDLNKNPRFNAINSGDYENIKVYKPQQQSQIIAYFGSDIEDFPDFKQNTAQSLPESSPVFNNFGSEYFLLPNPVSGTWRANYWK